MKIRLFLLFYVFGAFTSSVWATPIKGQRHPFRLTVVTLFRLLPAESGYFAVPERRNELLTHGKRIVDSQHDYLKIAGNSAQPALQLKVFRDVRGDVLAVSSYARGNYGFDLWRYENGHLHLASDGLAPVVEGDDLKYVLPRRGTTIGVLSSDGTLLVRLHWRKGRFVAEEVALPQ